MLDAERAAAVVVATESGFTIAQPFPGLRAYEPDESVIFFGREQHVQEVLRRLAANRFLGIVGVSGSGKSSLVRAGILPALYRGYLSGAATTWRIAVMRPGNAPLAELEKALAFPDMLGPDEDGSRSRTIRSSSFGLANAIRSGGMGSSDSLLIVVDQFEELFRFREEQRGTEQDGDAILFVSLLLEAAADTSLRVYVVLTMRSDFLGDCAQFAGLAEALSRSQYLIPRLTREQRQACIQRPLRLAGISMEPALLQELLNDCGEDPDRLPLLQHVLMMTHLKWKEAGGSGPVTLQHYRAAGGLREALHRHAETLYESLDIGGRGWAEQVFRALTTIEAGRAVRRPMSLARLYEVVGAGESRRHEVRAAIQPFLRRADSLLWSTTGAELREDSVIDLQHESLIWSWRRLFEWARSEQGSADWYRDLAQDTARNLQGASGYWTDPKLREAREIRDRNAWNAAWARLYWREESPTFEQTSNFLSHSVSAQARERWIWRGLWAGLAATFLMLAMFSYYSYTTSRRAKQLLEEKEVADLALKKAEQDQKDKEDQVAKLRDQEATQGELTEAQQQRLDSLTRELQQKTDTVSQLQAAANKPAGPDLSATVRTLQNQIDSLQKDKDAKTAENARLQMSLGDTQSKLTVAEGKTADLQSQIDAATKELNTLKATQPHVATDTEINSLLQTFTRYLVGVGLKFPPTLPKWSVRDSDLTVGYNVSTNEVTAGAFVRTNPNQLLWAYAKPFTILSQPSTGEAYLANVAAQYYAASFANDLIYQSVNDPSRPAINWVVAFWSIRQRVGKDRADNLIKAVLNNAGPRGTKTMDAYMRDLLLAVAGDPVRADVQAVLHDVAGTIPK